MKVIRCRDIGYDCDGVVRAETEEQALQMAAAHAKNQHGLKRVSADVLAKVKAAMHDEPRIQA